VVASALQFSCLSINLPDITTLFFSSSALYEMNTVKAVLNGHAPTTNGHHEEAPRDGFSPLVDEYETPLKIAIVGAGIGGLSAAIGLRRNGHEVEVGCMPSLPRARHKKRHLTQVKLYEQSRFANETGAAVHLAPNSNGILRRFGIYAEQFGGNPMTHLVEFSMEGKLMQKVDLREPNKRWQHPWLLVHRVSLHDQLKKLATSAEGEGSRAKLSTASKVISIDPEKGTLTLENGETKTADVIVGADGVYVRSSHKSFRENRLLIWDTQSLTRKYIKDVKPFSSGKAAFRFLIPRSVAEADPVTQPLVADKGALLMWYSDDRRIVMYPCNDNEMLNFVCIHPDTESHAAKSDGSAALPFRGCEVGLTWRRMEQTGLHRAGPKGL